MKKRLIALLGAATVVTAAVVASGGAATASTAGLPPAAAQPFAAQVAAAGLTSAQAVPAAAQRARGAAAPRVGFSLKALAVEPNIPVGRYSLATNYSPRSYCLEGTGSAVQTTLENCDDFNNAFWDIDQLTSTDGRGGAQVRFVNDQTGLCLDARTNATITPSDDTDPVQSYACNGTAQQTWYLWPLAGGFWMIVNTYNWNMVLDAKTDSTHSPATEGDPVQMYYHNGSAQQTWKIFN